MAVINVPLLFLGIDGQGLSEAEHAELIARLQAWKRGGGRVLMHIERPDLSLGVLTVDRMEQDLIDLNNDYLGGMVDLVRWCGHADLAPDPGDRDCWCRKPRPGGLIAMIMEIAQTFGTRSIPGTCLYVGTTEQEEAAANAIGVPFEQLAYWLGPQDFFMHDEETDGDGDEPVL